MTPYPRLAHALFAVGCLYAALAIVPATQGQSATDVPNDNATAPSDPSTLRPLPPPRAITKDGRTLCIVSSWQAVTEYMRYAEFINHIGYSEIQFKAETEGGKEPIVPRANYSKLLFIREDEEQDMRDILLDAFNRIKQIDRQIADVAEENQRNNPIAARPGPTFRAKEEELNRERKAIQEGAILKLRQSLSEETFNKIDDYLIRRSGTMEAVQNATFVSGPDSCKQPAETQTLQAQQATHE